MRTLSFLSAKAVRGLLVHATWACLVIASAARAGQQAVTDDPNTKAMAAYRYLHEHPELGHEEFLAHSYIKQALTDHGFAEFVESIKAPTAVIAVLHAPRRGPVIALRAELDARSLDNGEAEPLDHDPRSVIPGKMHNCGHDLHAATLLGAALELKKQLRSLRGTFIFVFQPAEETKGGADEIVDEGILQRLGVQAVFAQHSVPGMAVGTEGISSGTPLAGSAYFTLRIGGRGSHVAAPYEGDDLAATTSRLAQALTDWPARHLDIANHPAVISLTRIHADSGQAGSLPTQAEIKGSLRAFENPWQSAEGASLKDRIEGFVGGLAAANGVTLDWEWQRGSPPTINDAALFDEMIPSLQRQWHGKLATTYYRGMFSEDFSYYTPAIRSLYFSLGIAKDRLGVGAVHTTRFTVHPEAVSEGVAFLVLLAKTASNALDSYKPAAVK